MIEPEPDNEKSSIRDQARRSFLRAVLLLQLVWVIPMIVAVVGLLLYRRTPTFGAALFFYILFAVIGIYVLWKVFWGMVGIWNQKKR